MPKEDAIYKMDLETGQIVNLITINDIIDFDKFKGNDETSHWFEHIMLNPTGTRFAFYHRFGSNSNFITSCFTSDLEGNNIWQHPNKETERITHLGWINNTKYVLFTYFESTLTGWWKSKQVENEKPKLLVQIYLKIVKPFIPKKVVLKAVTKEDYYVTVEDQNGMIGTIFCCYFGSRS